MSNGGNETHLFPGQGDKRFLKSSRGRLREARHFLLPGLLDFYLTLSSSSFFSTNSFRRNINLRGYAYPPACARYTRRHHGEKRNKCWPMKNTRFRSTLLHKREGCWSWYGSFILDLSATIKRILYEKSFYTNFLRWEYFYPSPLV